VFVLKLRVARLKIERFFELHAALSDVIQSVLAAQNFKKVDGRLPE